MTIESVCPERQFFSEDCTNCVAGKTNIKLHHSSVQSRAFKWFINHIYINFHHLVHDNLAWWFKNNFFAESAAAIQQKMEEYGCTMNFQNRVALFIDCNCLETDRVGGGPTEDGANASRWDPLIERAFYNGWKSNNGLKHQTVDIAHGFTVDMCGPASLRRNDLVLLRDSAINDRISLLQEKAPEQFIIFGDTAYKRRSHITSYVIQNNDQDLQAFFVSWNRCMKEVRISIEWNYGCTVSLFKYLVTNQKLKVFESSTVSRIYTVATILRNCHIALYGCQSTNYYDISIPTDMLERYITQTDFEF